MLVEGDGKIGSVSIGLFNKVFENKIENFRLQKIGYVQFLNETFLQTLYNVKDENEVVSVIIDNSTSNLSQFEEIYLNFKK